MFHSIPSLLFHNYNLLHIHFASYYYNHDYLSIFRDYLFAHIPHSYRKILPLLTDLFNVSILFRTIDHIHQT